MKMRGEIVSLQVVRAVAATSVVATHAARAASIYRPTNIILPAGAFEFNPRWADAGAFGVDLFFVLSGFLMTYISRDYFAGRRSAGDFLIKRLVRIWPMYVIATALTLYWETLKASSAASRALDFQTHRLLGIVFVPSFNKDGIVAPILGVGWTLTYEFFFYICFAFVIAIRPKHPMSLLALILAVAYFFGLALPKSAFAVFLHNDVLFEFLVGAGLASLVHGGWKPRFGVVWIVAGCSALAFFTSINSSASIPRVFAGGIPASLVFCGALGLNSKVSFPRWLCRLGDASYSLYLFHIFLAGAIVNRMLALLVQTRLAALAVPIATITAVIGCAIVGVLIYLIVERRVLQCCTNLINLWFGRQESPPMVARWSR